MGWVVSGHTKLTHGQLYLFCSYMLELADEETEEIYEVMINIGER